MKKTTTPKPQVSEQKAEASPPIDPKCPHANLDAILALIDERVALTGVQWRALNNSAEFVRSALPPRKA